MDEKALIKTDPILQFLHFKVKIPIALIGPLSILLAVALIPIALITGVWSGIDYSMEQSYTTWIGAIFLCIANVFILRYYISIPKVLNELNEKGIITGENEAFQNFIKEIKQFYNLKYKKTIVLCLSFFLSMFLHILFLRDGLHGWTEIDALNGWSFLGYYNMLVLTIEINIIINLILNVGVTVRVLSRLVLEIKHGGLKYNFIRLCCFNTGGLKPFGDLALKCNLILVSMGCFVSVLVYTMIQAAEKFGIKYTWQIFEFMISIPLYLIITISIFFIHIYPIHKLMQFRKRELLEIVSKEDQEAFSLEKKSIEGLLKKKSRYEDLKYNSDIFELINRLPTWPFNYKVFSKLLTSVLLPVIPILIEIIT